MSISDEIIFHKTAGAALARYRAADDPELIAHRQELKTLTLYKHVQKVVDSWPFLTDDQLDRVATLLRPSQGGRAA